ncbi:MAG: ion channel [Planctomycetota bacterium]
MIKRNIAEFAVIFAVWWLFQMFFERGLSKQVAVPFVLITSFLKTAFFGIENIRQLMDATRSNLAYHRFMMLMLVNMAQIILSFGLDFHCLHQISPTCFSTSLVNATFAETVFEFIYFSTLNFTFFGYGDVTPQSIPAKCITMSEILLAFVTVIFLLSDFISLKESLRVPPK